MYTADIQYIRIYTYTCIYVHVLNSYINIHRRGERKEIDRAEWRADIQHTHMYMTQKERDREREISHVHIHIYTHIYSCMYI